jgi:hypothetical protein
MHQRKMLLAQRWKPTGTHRFQTAAGTKTPLLKQCLEFSSAESECFGKTQQCQILEPHNLLKPYKKPTIMGHSSPYCHYTGNACAGLETALAADQKTK